MAGGWNYSMLLDLDYSKPKSPYDEICKMLTLTQREYENMQEIMKFLHKKIPLD